MEIKRENHEGVEVVRAFIKTAELASALNVLIPTEMRNDNYAVDANSIRLDAETIVDRIEVVLHQRASTTGRNASRDTAAGEVPQASDVQRMAAGIPPRLSREDKE